MALTPIALREEGYRNGQVLLCSLLIFTRCALLTHELHVLADNRIRVRPERKGQ